MNAQGPLLALAEAHGIDAGYHDIWGNWHPLSEHTARALLDAMGVTTRCDQSIHEALDAASHHPWRTLAPPVVVNRDGDAAELLLSLSAARDDGRLHWQVRREDGERVEGESPVAQLEVVHEHQLGEQWIRKRRLHLPRDLPHGYHALTLQVDGHCATVSLIRTPRTCLGTGDARHWGVSLQLYGLRSARNWGMGDFTDLRAAVDVLAPLGASFIGLNPLHALYPDTPCHASPYSPSSRLHINLLYLDVEAMTDFHGCEDAMAMVAEPAFQCALAAARDSELVDYAKVARCKHKVLAALFAHFRARHLGTGSEPDRAFAAFREAGGDSLREHAVFEALQEHFTGQGRKPWPPGHEHPQSPRVAAFAEARAHRVLYFQYLQWQCSRQLDGCRVHARERGMQVGLYMDLAVGSDAFGSDVWAGAEQCAAGTSIGAPPDDFAPQGQVWGLPPWCPARLRDAAYQPFIACLRANMRHAGALRIDHVLGLLRQFWVPAGGDAADGAYVHYPVRDLLAITALESRRENCLVVGEDLGTVPDAMREALADFAVLSYRVFYFEKHWHGDHSFRAPGDYPREALVTLTTHDLATFAGYWTGHDLALRHQLGLFPSPEFEALQWETREQDRWRILDALAQQDLRPAQLRPPGEAAPERELVDAVHRFLARSGSALLSVQLEDVLGVVEQANVPGTVSEQPNWRRKLPLALEDLAGDPCLASLARAIRHER